jgi:hypothetical protein
MLDDMVKGGLAVLSGIFLIALVSVIVGKTSKAPQAIQAIGSAVGTVIAAAVSPAGTSHTNGDPHLSTFTTPILPASTGLSWV